VTRTVLLLASSIVALVVVGVSLAGASAAQDDDVETRIVRVAASRPKWRARFSTRFAAASDATSAARPAS